jgi:Transport and Golgi organisation 2
MCTVTVVRAGGLLRVACNRDESRQRPAAYAPFITRAGAQQVLTPQDPQGRGTWIAASSAGIVFALLNVNSIATTPSSQFRSRGLIIPALAGCSSIDEIAWGVEDIRQEPFAPCRLIAADDAVVVVVSIGTGQREVEVYPVAQPLLFTTSSLGDALVDGPRRLLFEQMIPSTAGRARGARDLAAQQDAFHAHRWRDRPAVSVHMSRPDACTVSTTVVEVSADEVRMVYQPSFCDAGTPVGLIISRQQGDRDAASRSCREYAAV